MRKIVHFGLYTVRADRYYDRRSIDEIEFEGTI